MATTAGAVPTTSSAPMDQAAYTAQMQQTANETMAFQLMQGKINQAMGMTTGYVATIEAMGQSAKNRGEAAKQLV